MDTLTPGPSTVDKSRLSVLPTLTQEGVSTIWELASDFIKQQYFLSKGVQIPNLGIFTFVRERLEVGDNKFIIAKRPLFFLSEKLVQRHGLRQNKIYVPGDIPTVLLNLVTISVQSSLSKDVVEGCIKDTLKLLAHSISLQKHVEFTFQGVGVLSIKDEKVKMKFFKDFLHAVDGSGSLVHFLANRPYTADSVISVTDAKRRPRSVLSFPRTDLKENEKKLSMETIVEEGEPSKPQTAVVKEKSDREGAGDKAAPVAQDAVLYKSEQKEPRAEEERSGRVPFTECPMKEREKPVPSTVPSCENHNKAGQELCYVCLQRAQRSIPVSGREEEKRREKEEDLILHQHLIWRDQKSLLRQRMKCLAEREQNQKNAAFNLGVADAMKTSRTQKPAFSNTYIFDKRPESACIRIAKQKEYAQSLRQQIRIKQEKALKEKQNKDMVERTERKEIKERAAAQREKFMKDKVEERNSYKRDLDTQIKNDKPLRLPASVEDSEEPIFGKDDGCMLILSHRNELECRKDQLKKAACNRRRRVLSGLTRQQQDVQTLKDIRKELLEERLAEARRVKSINEELLEHWGQSAREKRQREEAQKAFDSAANKLFLLDQCGRFQHCRRCWRSLSNDGKTHAWPLNKFLTGSRVYM